MKCALCGGEIPQNGNCCPNCGVPVIMPGPQMGKVAEPVIMPSPQMEKAAEPAVKLIKKNTWPSLILGFAGILCAVLSVFLPYIGINLFYHTESIRLYTMVDGWVILALALDVLFVVVILRNGKGLGQILSGLIFLLFFFVEFIRSNKEFQESGYPELYSFGIGFYLLLATSVFLLVSGTILFIKRRKIKC